MKFKSGLIRSDAALEIFKVTAGETAADDLLKAGERIDQKCFCRREEFVEKIASMRNADIDQDIGLEVEPGQVCGRHFVGDDVEALPYELFQGGFVEIGWGNFLCEQHYFLQIGRAHV